jgi:UDP-N-acetylmuramoyl-tripeptide--D-alanyl-D-alanine ligase
MDFYLSLVKPKIGVVTQIFWAHTQFLGNIEGISSEKGKMLQALPKNGWAVLNWDDENVRILTSKTTAKVFWFGTDPKKCDLWAENFEQNFSGSQFLLCQKGVKQKLEWSLVGRQNITTALASASLGLIYGLKLGEICQSLSSFRSLNSRINVREGILNSIILDDCYNSNPLAAKAALETLRDLARKRRKIAVLGDMLELGDYSVRAHKKLGESVIKNEVDLLFCFGKNSRKTFDIAQKSLGKNASWFKNINSLIGKLKKEIKSDDVILIKGSRAMHLEKVVEKLVL